MGSFPREKGKGNWLKALSGKIKKRKENLEREKENLHVNQSRCETSTSRANNIKSLERYAFGSHVVGAKHDRVVASEKPSVSYSSSRERDDEDDDFVARGPGKTEQRLLKDRLLMVASASLSAQEKEDNHNRKRDKNSSFSHVKAMREDAQLFQFFDVRKEKEHFEGGNEFWGRKCLPYRLAKEKEREKQIQQQRAQSGSLLRKFTTPDLLDYDFSSLPAETGIKAVVLRPPLRHQQEEEDKEGGDHCTITHGQLSKLLGNICRVLSTGLVFMWVEKTHIPMAIKCLSYWSCRYVENLTWVQVDAQYRPRCDKSAYLRSSHLTLLIARRDKGSNTFELRHQRNCDLIVAPELSNEDWPNKVYQIIETLLPETEDTTTGTSTSTQTTRNQGSPLLPDLLHITWNRNDQSEIGARWMRIAEKKRQVQMPPPPVQQVPRTTW
jgi:hypothetical protein